MTRKEQYQWFCKSLANLLNYCALNNMVVKGMEWYRTPERAAQLSKEGTGIKNSKHCFSLAVDLYLVTESGKDIIWGKKGTAGAEKYKLLGIYWESMGGIWGGNFSSLYDPYHFEVNGKPA